MIHDFSILDSVLIALSLCCLFVCWFLFIRVVVVSSVVGCRLVGCRGVGRRTHVSTRIQIVALFHRDILAHKLNRWSAQWNVLLYRMSLALSNAELLGTSAWTFVVWDGHSRLPAGNISEQTRGFALAARLPRHGSPY